LNEEIEMRAPGCDNGGKINKRTDEADSHAHDLCV
jgi:hypothetical protein